MIRTFDRIRRMFRRNGRAAAAGSSERRDVVTASEVNYFGLATLLIDQFGSEARAEAARLTREAILGFFAQRRKKVQSKFISLVNWMTERGPDHFSTAERPLRGKVLYLPREHPMPC